MLYTRNWHQLTAILAALTLSLFVAPLLESPVLGAPVREVTWNKNFTAALVNAKRQDKLVLAYFSGSDWDEWGKKLEKEVLKSQPFVEWANKNVIPFQADYPAAKKQNLYEKQNEELKVRYQLSKVPTFLFLDGDGEIVAKATYDDLKLLPEETEGQPVAAIKFLDKVLANRPESEQLIVQPSLLEAVNNAREHKLPVLLMLIKGEKDPMIVQSEKLLQSQRFVRWVNVNTSFYKMKWPDPADKSEEAVVFKGLAEKLKIGNTPAQLLMWVPDEDKLRSRTMSWNIMQMEPLMARLSKDLPPIEYKGTDWLADVRTARAIMAQQPKRVMFLYFTDGSEFCEKFEKEILKTEEFTTWPYYAFVFVKLDYTKGVKRPKYSDDQNKSQAELYGIRGYPMVVLVNPKGQKIGEAKYMKGGPKPFLAELRRLYNADIDRRLLTDLGDERK
jgi:thioredoxin-related protein